MLDAESAHPRVLKDPPTADSAEVGSGRISASYQRQKSAAATAFSGGDGQVLQFVIPSEAPPRGRRGICYPRRLGSIPPLSPHRPNGGRGRPPYNSGLIVARASRPRFGDYVTPTRPRPTSCSFRESPPQAAWQCSECGQVLAKSCQSGAADFSDSGSARDSDRVQRQDQRQGQFIFHSSNGY